MSLDRPDYESLFYTGKSSDNKIWACLLHLSFNMWEEFISPHRPFRGFRPDLRLSESLWNDAIEAMAKQKMNMIVIDLGDAVEYESHPEIVVRNAWSVTKLRKELDRLRKMGLEPIPKLNFSAAHDTWLKSYSRMVSTEKYYTVCKDLIAEVYTLFNKPRFFHLGMDEETIGHQTHYNYAMVRENDVWWGDFYFLIGEVEKLGCRPWIWADYVWHHPEMFFENMPKSVIQGNWYYGEKFNLTPLNGSDNSAVRAYIDLEANGYDQIPTGSFHADNEKSILNTIDFCSSHIDHSRLLGFLQTFWKPTIEENRERILNGIDLAGKARQWYDLHNS